MNNINRICISGNLCKDFEVKNVTDSFSVGSGAIAVNRSVKRGEEWVDEASFFDFKILGSRAPKVEPYLKKGTRVYIDGVLIQDRWEKDGQKFSRVYIQADNIEFSFKNERQDAPQNDAPAPVNADGFPEDVPF